MKNIKTLHTVPETSILSTDPSTINYCDSFRIPLSANQSVDQITTKVFQTPRWVSYLMRVRNTIVKLFGLRTNTDLVKQADYYPIGSKAVYFTVVDRNDNEIVMGENDKHLDFKVSALADRVNGFAYVTTVIRFNNGFGKFYFAIIRPFHRIIVKRMAMRAID